MRKLLKTPFNKIVFGFLVLFFACSLFAPFLASSKPIFVIFQDEPYFPLFRYLLYQGFYTKNLDRFFNLMMLITPFALCSFLIFPKKKLLVTGIFGAALITLFTFFEMNPIQNPAWTANSNRSEAKTWKEELAKLNPYAQLNMVVEYRIMKREQRNMSRFLDAYHALLEKRKGKQVPNDPSILPTLWNQREENLNQEIARLESEGTSKARQRLEYLQDRELWLRKEQNHLRALLMPLIRPYNWEDDRGGNQLLNDVVPWYELSRINRKDLTAALIFGTRISLVVGFMTVLIALIIGIPFGAMAGYFGGKFDIFLSRILEVWEGMPVLFMLLTVVAITEVKSIFWIIVTIGIFGWTGFARYVRAETLRVKPLAFVEAAKAIGFGKMKILFSHVLPNSLTAVLVLIPFAILGAISSESGLSFLGLGEEGSCSLGVLMDEGRANFPAESYLLWPPAIVLSLLLIAIALLNDGVRDALDPRVD